MAFHCALFVKRVFLNEYVQGSLATLGLLLLFACIFAFGVERDAWSFADAFYFCAVTFTYGDVVPTNTASKITTCIFVVLSLATIAVIVTRSLGHALESFAKSLAHAGGKKEGQRLIIQLSVPIGLLFAVFLGNCMFLGLSNETDVITAIYAAIVTQAAVGYGDVTFVSPRARILGGMWLLGSTFVSAWSLSWIVQAVLLYRRQRHVSRLVTASEFARVDRDGNKAISKYEFVLFKLQEVVTEVDDRLIRRIEEQFDQQQDYLESLEAKADEIELDTKV